MTDADGIDWPPELPPGPELQRLWGQHMRTRFNERMAAVPIYPAPKPLSKREMLIRHREQLDAEIAELDVALSTYGDEPAKNGAVIRFRKRFSPSGQTFRYAGIRAGGLWYLTGSRAPQRQTWDQLIAWLSGGAPAVAFEVVHPGGKHQTTERIDIIPLDPKATGC